MSWHNFDYLDPRTAAEITEIITNDMAEDSDFGGDEDADDDLDSSCRANTSTTRSHSFSQPSTSAQGSQNVREFEDFQTNINQLSSEDTNSSSSDDEISDRTQWSKTGGSPRVFEKTDFKMPFGLTEKAEVDINSPKNILKLFFPSIFLAYIVEQSNLYANQLHQQLNLTVEELEAFIGILIVMGFHRLPSIRLYWSQDENFSVMRVTRVFSLKRFLKILRYLHLNDNHKMPKRNQVGFDKLYKIRPLINHMNEVFRSMFSPSRYLSIDESMVRFKGRSSLKQYMPMKPVKRGFKVWMIACAVTGYCLGFSVYEGNDGQGIEHSLGEKVVTSLSRYLEGLGYCLFFDNFFTSIDMTIRLLRKLFFCCATIRQSRKKFPSSWLKTDSQMKKGDIDAAQYNNVGISKWKDRGNKSVSVVSTMHNPFKKSKVLRTNKSGGRDLVTCPKSIEDYNKYMGGVDRFDQLHATYNVAWKSRRWWMKIFYYCVDAAIVNSYVMYNHTMKKVKPATKPLTHLQFRSTLASELIGSFVGRKKSGPIVQKGRGRKRGFPDGRPTIQNTIRLSNVGTHLPLKGPTYRRCAHCSTSTHQKRTKITCEGCKVAVCIECFGPFHESTPFRPNN